MRILATAAADSSGWYRLRQPIEQLQAEGHDIDFTLADRVGLPLEFDRHGRFVDAHFDCDILILQRPMWSFMPDVITHAQRKGIPVIVELDDDFHTAHPHNRAFQLHHPRRNKQMNWHHLGECVRRADLVTVATPALARRYGSHGRVVVLRNCISDDWLTIPRGGDGRTLGWAGTMANHATDPQAIRGGVALALADHPDWRFLIAGGAEHLDEAIDAFELRQLPTERTIEASPWVPLDLHPYMVRFMDVGIVPLADLAFNHGKSCLKGLESASLGIPFVASPVAEYRWLAAQGIGVTAAWRARSWRAALKPLMSDREHLESESRRLREAAAAFTIGRNAWRWLEVWQDVARAPARRRAA